MRLAKDMAIYVADTSCCGPVMHDPRNLGVPCHARRAGKDDHLPPTESYPACTILRYVEFRPARQISRAEIMRDVT